MTIRQDLQFRQGETWTFTYVHKDAAGSIIDLTGYSARMAIKAGFGDSFEAYLSSGADANGGTITLGGAAGTVVMSMTATESKQLAGDLQFYGFDQADIDRVLEPQIELIYDLELEDGSGVVTRALEGRVIVNREATV